MFRSDFLFAKRRVYPKPPVKMRLQIWLNRVNKRCAKFGRPIKMQIRASHADDLGLPDNWVILDECGRLYHATSKKPIAYVAQNT